jgi:hypothetical protein
MASKLTILQVSFYKGLGVTFSYKKLAFPETSTVKEALALIVSKCKLSREPEEFSLYHDASNPNSGSTIAGMGGGNKKTRMDDTRTLISYGLGTPSNDTVEIRPKYVISFQFPDDTTLTFNVDLKVRERTWISILNFTLVLLSSPLDIQFHSFTFLPLILVLFALPLSSPSFPLLVLLALFRKLSCHRSSLSNQTKTSISTVLSTLFEDQSKIQAFELFNEDEPLDLTQSFSEQNVRPNATVFFRPSQQTRSPSTSFAPSLTSSGIFTSGDLGGTGSGGSRPSSVIMGAGGTPVSGGSPVSPRNKKSRIGLSLMGRVSVPSSCPLCLLVFSSSFSSVKMSFSSSSSLPLRFK